jgi:ribosomal protein L32
MKHATYDDGAVDGASYDIFGFVPDRKTSKTMCGKRVATKHIAYASDVDCPECLKERQNRIDGYERIKAYCKSQGIE